MPTRKQKKQVGDKKLKKPKPNKRDERAKSRAMSKKRKEMEDLEEVDGDLIDAMDEYVKGESPPKKKKNKSSDSNFVKRSKPRPKRSSKRAFDDSYNSRQRRRRSKSSKDNSRVMSLKAYEQRKKEEGRLKQIQDSKKESINTSIAECKPLSIF